MSFQKSLRQSLRDVRVLLHAEVVSEHVERSATLQGAFLRSCAMQWMGTVVKVSTVPICSVSG